MPDTTWLAARPEDLVLHEAAEAQGLRASVVTSAFQGRYTEVVLALGAHRLVAHDAACRMFAPGAELAVSFPPECALCLRD
jgi:hypothetical protein